MMYCSHCGVRLEPAMTECPLCGGRAQESEEPTLSEYHILEPVPVEPVLRRIVRRSLASIAATAVVILLIVDVGTGEGLSWAPLAIVPVVAGAMVLMIPFAVRRWCPGFSGAMVTVLAMLAALDGLGNAALEWFIPVALPITVATGLVVAIERAILRRVAGAIKGAALLAGAGLLTAAVDASVQRYLTGSASLTWSLVILVSTLPTAGLLVVLQRSVLRYIDLRRRFHV